MLCGASERAARVHIAVIDDAYVVAYVDACVDAYVDAYILFHKRAGQNEIGTRSVKVTSGVSRVRPAPIDRFTVVRGVSRYE